MSYPKQYLIYDAACPMCRSFITRLNWLGLTKDMDGIQPVPNTDFDFGEALNSQVREKLGYEMQLVEPDTETIYSGVDVMLQILGRIPWLSSLAPLLKLPVIYPSLRFFYRLIAYNRKILTPPDSSQISCACDPIERGIDVYRVSLWLICCLMLMLSLHWVNVLDDLIIVIPVVGIAIGFLMGKLIGRYFEQLLLVTSLNLLWYAAIYRIFANIVFTGQAGFSWSALLWSWTSILIVILFSNFFIKAMSNRNQAIGVSHGKNTIFNIVYRIAEAYIILMYLPLPIATTTAMLGIG